MHFPPHCHCIQGNVDLENVVKVSGLMGRRYGHRNWLTWMLNLSHALNIILYASHPGGLSGACFPGLLSIRLVSRNFSPIAGSPDQFNTTNSPDFLFSIAAHLPISFTQDSKRTVIDKSQFFLMEQWNQIFFSRIGSAWSPAETVRHLTKSTRPVVKALRMPRILLRLLFGKARRASMTYDEFCSRYVQALAEGGQAGRFAPSAQSHDDQQSWRTAIMRDFTHVNEDLQLVVRDWPEARLDRFQLPHPLLGKLTVREMLFFTLYHHRHHMAVVERRLREL